MQNLRFFLLALLVGLSSIAQAQRLCTQYRVGTDGSWGAEWKSTKESACSSWFADARAAGHCPDVPGASGGTCTYVATDTYCYSKFTQNIDGAIATQSWKTYQTKQGTCGPVCEEGKQQDYNLTGGWNRGLGADSSYPDLMPDGSVPPVGYLGIPPSSLCLDSCIQNRGAIKNAWVSTTAVNGMYRVSTDWTYTSTAIACTATAADDAISTPSSTAPPCLGSVGLINGKSVCVPSSEGQVNTVQGDKPPSESKTGNPAAGKATGTIPATGTGTSSGGPATPNDGIIGTNPGGGPGGALSSTGSGTTTTATGTGTAYTFSTCGLPGKPACKIDETGVPGTATTKIDIEAMTATEETRRGTISGTGDKNNLFSGFAAYFAIPPLATCQPIPMPVSAVGVQIPSMDPCATVDGIRSFMGYLWALAGLYLCVGFVRKAIA